MFLIKLDKKLIKEFVVRISSLDGLRGFSVILVMIFHTFLPYTQGGFIGVDIFFVLSGFLITTLFLKEYESRKTLNLKNFYIRRILRLTPALVLFLSTFYIYSQFFMDAADKDSAASAALSALFYFANLAKAYDWIKLGALGHTWSLSIEEQFYFIWPAVFLFFCFSLKSKKNIAIAISIIIVSLWLNRILLTYSDASIGRLYNGSDTHSDGLFMGCLAALLINIYRKKFISFTELLRKYKISIPLISLLFFIVATPTMGIDIRSIYVWFLPLLNIVVAVLICFLYCKGNTYKTPLLSNKYLVWLGGISYGVYLWHWFVYRVLMGFGMDGVYVGLFGSVIAIAIASLSFYMIEKPILKVKKKFS